MAKEAQMGRKEEELGWGQVGLWFDSKFSGTNEDLTYLPGYCTRSVDDSVWKD
jgi:hypothetical protein